MSRALGALVLVAAALAWAAPRGASRASFELPSGWRSAPAVPTPPVELAFTLTPPAALPLTAALTVEGGKLTDAELEQAAGERHAARVKNRVAWGMKADGGPPREATRVGARRALRFRDRVGGALGASEQIMTCAVVAARLACVTTSGPAGARDAAEALASTVLGTLKLR